MWCGVIGDQIIGPYIFAQRLTGAIYANFLRDELPALLENVPLQTRLQMYYQHDAAPPHFSQVLRHSDDLGYRTDVQCIVVGSQWTTMTRVRVFL